MRKTNTSRRSAIWLAITAATVMATGVIALWYVIDKRAHEHAGSSTDHSIYMNELLIQQDAENRQLALDRLAHRWATRGEQSRIGWEADATRYFTDMPGFVSILWVDESLEILWRVDSSEYTDGMQKLAAVEPVRAALEQAYESGQQVFSEVFLTSSQAPRLAVLVPVSHGTRKEGVMAGILSPDHWLGAVIGHLQGTDHHVEIDVEGNRVYENIIAGDVPDTTKTITHRFDAGGLDWVMRVTPTSSFLSAGHADASSLVLIVGLLLSAFTAFAVYFGIAARDRSRQFHDIALQLETLFRNLPGMAYRRIKAANLPMAFVSEGCLALSGYLRADFAEGRRDWLDLLHVDDRERVTGEIQTALTVGDSYEVEYRIYNCSNDIRWMWERGRAVPSEVDQEVHLEGFVTDITDRKEATDALVEARAFSEAVLDTAADAIITIGADGQIETFNDAAQRMFGYRLKEAIGKHIGDLMDDTHRAENGQFLRRYLDADEAAGVSTSREIKALRKDGSTFPIHLSISEVQSRGDRKIVGLIHDVSEQRAAENEAREHREQLAHVDRLNMLGEMASGIAHEINQPLTAISLFVQAGERLVENKNYEKLPEICSKLIQHAHRASAVIERMQNMARRHESAKEVISCEDLIRDVVRLAESEASIRDMSIKVDIQPGLPGVSVDSVQIQQVALNLLRNGMEAMQSVGCRNGNTIGLTALQRDDGRIEISVIDKGSGVPDDAVDKLFAPFSTTKKSGMGMGLSISRAIVTAHGGRLDFRNNDDGGATFFFTLPPAALEDAS